MSHKGILLEGKNEVLFSKGSVSAETLNHLTEGHLTQNADDVNGHMERLKMHNAFLKVLL